jgi:NTE family protein
MQDTYIQSLILHEMRILFRYLILVVLFVITACASTSQQIILPDEPPTPRKIENVGVALVLGAGGARGVAHLGVIEVLEQYNIPIDLIVGCSAGSIVGAFYADYVDSKMLYENLINTHKWEFLDFSFADAFMFFSDLKAPFQGAYLERFMVQNLSVNNMEDLTIPFIAVATDLNEEKPYLFSSGSIAAAVRASTAIPPYFTPLKAYGRLLVDGGVTEPVPVKTARLFDPKLVIAVDIGTTGREYTLSTMWDLTNRALAISYYQLSQMQSHQADVLIHPDLSGIGTFDDDNNYNLYKLGKLAAHKMIPQIMELLHQKGIKLKKR